MERSQTKYLPLPASVTSYVPIKAKRGPRATVACDSCRRLKAKCDQNMPCCVCVNNSLECIYRSGQSYAKKRKTSDSQTARRISVETTGNGAPRNETCVPTTIPRLFQQADDSLRAAHPPNLAKDAISRTALAPDDIVAEPSISSLLQDDQIEEEPLANPLGFGEINKRTNGKEFYGPTATLAFLLQLRLYAKSFQIRSRKRSAVGKSKGSSIVNFLHGDDDTTPALVEDQTLGNGSYFRRSMPSPASLIVSQNTPSNQEIERECINLYFVNLHLIYCFLDRTAFIARCEGEIWSQTSAFKTSSRFPALYNAVVALGALTAGDDTVLAENRDTPQESPDNGSNQCLELAKVYFGRTKSLLGDIFEVCCLENVQTLLLMSIFCQYSLRPHGAYMYSGMSARMALAIGSANDPNLKNNPLEAIRTWWCNYYHEMEVSSSLGRENLLKEPSYYPVFLARFGDPFPVQTGLPSTNDETLVFARCMTELAHILKQTSDEIYHIGSTNSRQDKSETALKLDKKLVRWKEDISPVFDMENTSLTERESLTKRKIVLKLRFYSARILIHRPFLIAAVYQGESSSVTASIQLCVEASRKTIHVLYETFVNRPFFRTWWYNTTYAFNAIIIILYMLISPLRNDSTEELLSDVEKTLKIFQAMSGIGVARRYAELTQEIFDIAKSSLEEQRSGDDSEQMQRNTLSSHLQNMPSLWDQMGDLDNFPSDFFTEIMDFNILDDFSPSMIMGVRDAPNASEIRR